MIQSRKCLRRWMLAGMCLLCAVALTGLAAQVVGAGCDWGCYCNTKNCYQNPAGIVIYTEYDSARCTWGYGPNAFGAQPDNATSSRYRMISFMGWTEENGFTPCPCNVNVPLEDWVWDVTGGGVVVIADWHPTDINTYCNHCE
jgi:hypothetical protein